MLAGKHACVLVPDRLLPPRPSPVASPAPPRIATHCAARAPAAASAWPCPAASWDQTAQRAVHRRRRRRRRAPAPPPAQHGGAPRCRPCPRAAAGQRRRRRRRRRRPCPCPSPPSFPPSLASWGEAAAAPRPRAHLPRGQGRAVVGLAGWRGEQAGHASTPSRWQQPTRPVTNRASHLPWAVPPPAPAAPLAHAHARTLQRAHIVGSVAAHQHVQAHGAQGFHNHLLLLGRHAGVNLRERGGHTAAHAWSGAGQQSEGSPQQPPAAAA